jgi:hypothetical protein
MKTTARRGTLAALAATVAVIAGAQVVGGLLSNTGAATPEPAVTALSPTSGPTAGGTTVTITGTNLSGARTVKFGGTKATTFAVDSATQITATAPAHAAGPVTVTGTTPGGTSATSSADQFTYVKGISYLAGKTTYVTAGFGASSVSIPFTPGAVGDLVVVNVSTDVTIAGTPASISDTAGHIAWQPRVIETQTTPDPRFFTVWIGTVTATGATTITVTWTGGDTGHKELTLTSWRSSHGAATTWSVVGDASYAHDGTYGIITVPPVTATASSTEFYWCSTIADGSSHPATTQGLFTFLTDTYTNTDAYRLNLTTGTPYSPRISYTSDIGVDALIFQAS